jgi:YgiT-type zinc finger domain-containing protein
MFPFPTCPVCGGEVIEKEVEEILRGGDNAAIVRVKAEICLHCGGRLFDPETIERFEQIVEKLVRQEIQDFNCIGRSYAVPVS